MSFSFTSKEINQLKELSKDYPELSEKVLSIQPNEYYQTYHESVRNDVLEVIDGNGYEDVSDDNLSKIITRVMNYDSGNYNDFIDETISNIVNNG